MKRILNIGCGKDENSTDFLDLYPSRKEVIKYNADIDRIPFEDNTFEGIICNFLLEHLKDRVLFFKEVRRVLKKNGKLKLCTDNAGWFGYHNMKSKVKTHYGGYCNEDYGDDDKHYSLFTTEHLKQFLIDAGFKEISVNLYNRDNHILSKKIKFINWIFQKTQFYPLGYAQLKVVCVK